MTVGKLPEDDEPDFSARNSDAPDRQKKPPGPPRRGTHRYLFRYFQDSLRSLGQPGCNDKMLNATLRLMRTKYGLQSYDEMQIVVEKFFLRHEDEVRVYAGNSAVQFRHMLPQLLKESEQEIENLRNGTVRNIEDKVVYPEIEAWKAARYGT